jgi:hypothetical protein
MVVGVAAVISYQHAYELVTTYGETGFTAHLFPFTDLGPVDGGAGRESPEPSGTTPGAGGFFSNSGCS